jgi:hypothetical protein
MEKITLKELMDIVENVEMYNSEYQLIEDKFKNLLHTKLKTLDSSVPDEYNVGDRVLINYKKVSNRDQYIIVKINSKYIEIKKTNVGKDSNGDSLNIHASLLQKI